MRKVLKRLNTLACILFFAFSNLYAFDGERKGFILGGGIGAGFLSNTVSFKSSLTRDYRAVFLTNFKIGYAPSNTWEIYYINKASWWVDSDITFILGLSAIAITVYTDNTTKTGWFISGGLGLSKLDAPFESGLESTNGYGLFVGQGYEFSRRWNLEVDFLYSTIGADRGILVTINVLAF
jgi:hypothetical protein